MTTERTIDTRIQIIGIDTRSGVSKTSGRPYNLTEAQCILIGPHVKVGRLVLNTEQFPDVKPGTYDAQFTLGVDREGRIVPQLHSLKLIKAGNAFNAAA